MDSHRYSRLHELFCQASEMAGHQRRAYLEQECGDDVKLIDEVLQLLAKDNSSLFSIPDEPVASLGEAEKPPRIEGYRIHELLGQGGMGHVWRATQLSTRREVALKVLPAFGLRSVLARNQFHREAELAARITHPNVAQIYDCGIDDGCAFYAMELIDGVDLATYVTRANLSRHEIVKLMETVCRAVEQAHHRGVIHRDLKPSNILVTEKGRPVLVDFGVATSLWADPEGPSVTAHGLLAGTPAYMSPEQAAGSREQIDTRSDVYSLGVLLYRLLLGRPPHDTTGSPLQALRRILEEDLVRPRQVDPGLDPNLEAVILKALDRDPGKRYGTAGELGNDLENYLANRPVSARRLTMAYMLAMYLRRHRLRLAAAIAFFLIPPIVGTGYVIVTKQHEREALELAEFAELERQEAVAAKKQADRLAYVNLLQLAVGELQNYQYQRAENLLANVDSQTKGWELRHLKWRASPNDRSRWQLPPFVDFVQRLAFSPDGRRLAIATAGSTTEAAREPLIVVVDVESGKVVSELRGHRDGIFALTFTNDGEQILSGGRDRSLRRWSVSDGQQLEVRQTVEPGSGSNDGLMLFDVKFSPDHQRLAFAAYPQGLFLADVAPALTWQSILESATLVVPMSGEDDWIRFTADGNQMFWSTRVWQENVGHLFVINPSTGEVLHHVERPPDNPIYSIDLSIDGKSLLTSDGGETVSEIDRTSLQVRSRYTGHQGSAIRAFYLPSGEHLISLARDSLVRFWNVKERRPVCVMYPQRGAIGTAMALDPAGRHLAVATAPENIVRLFDVATAMSDPSHLVRHNGKARAIALSPNKQFLASVGDDGWVKLTNLETGEILWSQNNGFEHATAVTFSDHHGSLIIGRSIHPDSAPNPPYGQLVFLDATSGNPLRDPLELDGWVWKIAAEPSGTRLAVAMGVSSADPTRTGSVAVLDSSTSEILHLLPVQGPRCRSVSWSPDGKYLVTAAEQELALWDVESGRRVNQDLAKDGRNFVRHVHEGRLLLTATGDVVELRDATTLQVARQFQQPQYAHENFLYSNIGDAVISPDGKRLMSGSWNKMITIWDTETADPLLTFRGHDAGIHGLILTPDGKELFSVGHDGNVRRWQTTP